MLASSVMTQMTPLYEQKNFLSTKLDEDAQTTTISICGWAYNCTETFSFYRKF